MLKKVSWLGQSALAAVHAPSAQAPTPPPCSTAKMIVPWGAGGDTYIIFKVFEEVVNRENPDHQIQLINMPGQGGNKGAKEAVKAKPDGCTLFAIHQSAIISYLNGRVDFTWDAFEPIAKVSSTPDLLAASGQSGIKNFEDMKRIVTADRDKAAVAVTFGSTSHFSWLILAGQTGLDFKFVPYDGTAERVTALLSNTVQLGTTNVTTSKKQFETGELVPLMLLR